MNRTFRHLLVPCLLALVTTTAACELISTVDRSTIGGTSGTGGAGGASTATTTTTGDMATGTGGAGGAGGATATSGGTGGMTTTGTGLGGGGGSGGATSSVASSSVASSSVASSSSTGAGCVNPATDCPSTGNVCVVAVCAGAACSTMNVAANTPTGPQVAGDCKQGVCDGAGSLITIDDNTDHVADGEACTDDICVAGMPAHPPLAGGTDCAAEGPAPKHLCGTVGGAAAGKCVECNAGTDCASKVCTGNACIAATCMDGVQNGTETGIDCGGAACAACPVTCFDGLKNGTETDIDCGGNVCAANCAVTQGCAFNVDCASNNCGLQGCQPAGTCSNAIQDGTETDKNCGGLACSACTVGLKCLINGDCASKSCNTAVSPHVCN
jgi:hypothetical protein